MLVATRARAWALVVHSNLRNDHLFLLQEYVLL